LLSFLWSQWSWSLPLRRLLLSLSVVPKHIRFVTSNDVGYEVRVFSASSFSSVQTEMWYSFWSLLSSLDTNFAAMHLMLSSSDKFSGTFHTTVWQCCKHCESFVIYLPG
jgi:hypothetical protein